MRNSHLKSLLLTHTGLQTLTNWCNLISNNLLHPYTTTLYNTCLCRPLSKPQGGVRPIVLFDCLFKMATGSLLDTYTYQSIKQLSPHQFGMGLTAEGRQDVVHTTRTYTTTPTTHFHIHRHQKRVRHHQTNIHTTHPSLKTRTTTCTHCLPHVVRRRHTNVTSESKQ